jgi:transcriptional regulator with XRE-family HTH domain
MDLELLQREAADQIGTRVENLTNWERGKHPPAIRFLPGIIRFLGYDPLPDGETAGDRIRQSRKKLGLSQRKLADLLGVDPSTVWKWERQRRPLSDEQAKRLEHHLNANKRWAFR